MLTLPSTPSAQVVVAEPTGPRVRPAARLRAGTGRRARSRDRSSGAPPTRLSPTLGTGVDRSSPSAGMQSRHLRARAVLGGWVGGNSRLPATIGAALVIRLGGTAIANPPAPLIL